MVNFVEKTMDLRVIDRTVTFTREFHRGVSLVRMSAVINESMGSEGRAALVTEYRRVFLSNHEDVEEAIGMLSDLDIVKDVQNPILMSVVIRRDDTVVFHGAALLPFEHPEPVLKIYFSDTPMTEVKYG